MISLVDNPSFIAVAFIRSSSETVARSEAGKNEPRGANLKLLLELEKQVKQKKKN